MDINTGMKTPGGGGTNFAVGADCAGMGKVSRGESMGLKGFWVGGLFMPEKNLNAKQIAFFEKRVGQDFQVAGTFDSNGHLSNLKPMPSGG